MRRVALVFVLLATASLSSALPLPREAQRGEQAGYTVRALRHGGGRLPARAPQRTGLDGQQASSLLQLSTSKGGMGGAAKGGAAGSKGGAKGGSSGSCCQVCPAKFYDDLSLMELSEDVAAAALTRFHRWHRQTSGSTVPLKGVPLSMLLQMSVAKGGSMGGSSSKGGAAGGAAGKGGAGGAAAARSKGGILLPPPGQIGGGPCCSVCPMQFIQPRDYDETSSDMWYLHQGPTPTSLLQQQQQESGTAAAAAAVGSKLNARRRSLPLSQTAASAAHAQSVVKPSALITLSSRASKGGMAMAKAAGAAAGGAKGGAGGKGGDKGGGGCCNVCPAQMYPPRSYEDTGGAMSGGAMTSTGIMLQLASEQKALNQQQAAAAGALSQSEAAALLSVREGMRVNKGGLLGAAAGAVGGALGGAAGGGSTLGGAGSCCKLCASRFYENAAPFNEPHLEPHGGPFARNPGNKREYKTGGASGLPI